MKGKNKGLITGDHFQVLCNAVGGGTVSDFLEKSIRKVYSSTLLALRGGGSQISGGGGGKRYGTLECHSGIRHIYELDRNNQRVYWVFYESLSSPINYGMIISEGQTDVGPPITTTTTFPV